MSSMGRRNVRLKTKRAAREIEAPPTDTAVEAVRAANAQLVVELTLAFVEGDTVLGALPMRLHGARPPAGQPLRVQVPIKARALYDELGKSLHLKPANGLAVAKPGLWVPGQPQ